MVYYQCYVLIGSGFSNWKKVAGGNCKVAGALSDHDNGSLGASLGKFWKSGCLD